MDLSFLRTIFEQPPGQQWWASVYLDASHDTEDAEHAIDLRWRAAREELERAGADEATLGAIADVATGPPQRSGSYGLAIFATGGRVVHTDVLPDPPRAPLVSWDPLPHAMPAVAQRGERVAWLRVVVDRTGADLVGASAGGLTRTASVQGGNAYPMRKVNAGGWSHRRYHEAAEETWDRNAKEIAAAVIGLAGETGADVLVVAGDVRERQLLLEHLPERWAGRVVQTERGSRADGADPEPLDQATLEAVAERGRARVAEVLDRFRTQLGREAAAGTGLPAVVAALQRGQVDTLLLVDDPSSTQRLWVGPAPTDIAFSEADLAHLGDTRPVEVRADAALLRALVGTDADLIVVASTADDDAGDAPDVSLDGGVGALLRYADASTRHR